MMQQVARTSPCQSGLLAAVHMNDSPSLCTSRGRCLERLPHAADRMFTDSLANTASLPHTKRIGPDYAASAVALFRALARAAPSVDGAAHSEDERLRYLAAASFRSPRCWRRAVRWTRCLLAIDSWQEVCICAT